MTPSPLALTALIVWLVLAATIAAVTVPQIDPTRSDFATFYASSQAWMDGTAQYGAHVVPNMNPPTMAILLAPLTAVPLVTAFWIWTGLCALIVVASLALSVRHRPIPITRVLWALGALVISYPALTGWILGQLAWLLCGFVTLAWCHADRPKVSGAWLGLAIAVKPPYALMALALPWPICRSAAVTSMAVTAGAMLVTGLEPWRDWLAMGHTVDWFDSTMNASVWGIAARLSPDVPQIALDEMSRWALVPMLAAGVMLAPFVVQEPNKDTRWVLALFWSLLLSPLGWIYYIPTVIGPLLASWPRHRAAIIGLVVLSLPLSPVPWPPMPRLAVFLADSIYTCGVLCLWWAYLRPHPLSSEPPSHDNAVRVSLVEGPTSDRYLPELPRRDEPTAPRRDHRRL